MSIYETMKKSLKRYRINNAELALFSVYFSKNMKSIILQKIAGEIDCVYMSPEMIESYLPGISDNQINAMLEIISKVWDEQLSICEMCPTRCISEKEKYCVMFDDEFYCDEEE